MNRFLGSILWAWTCFFGSMSLSLYAQTRSDTPACDLDHLIYTGSPEPVSASRSVYRVHSVDREQIQQMGAITLKDVLSQQLNIRLANDPVLGSGLGMMGMSGQNIKILLDGIPLVGRQNGQIDLNQINLQDIKKIEIIEGPMSVFYGTDAMGGVINLITRGTSPHHRWRIETGHYHENNFTFNQRVGMMRQMGKSQISVQFSRIFFGGFAPNWNWDTRIHTFKPRIQHPWDFKYSLHHKKAVHHFQWNGNQEIMVAYGTPVISPVKIYAPDALFNTQRFQIGLTHDVHWNSKWKGVFQESFSYFNRIRKGYLKDLVSGEKTYQNEETDTSRFQLAMLRGYIYINSKKSRWGQQLGYDLQHEWGKAQRVINNSGITDLALFYIINWKIKENFEVRSGVRKAYNTLFHAPWLPNIQIRWDLGKYFQWRMSAATGFRAPTLKELYLYFVDQNHNIQGNPDLKPENGKHFQGALSFKKQKKGNIILMEGNMSMSSIQNLIGLAITDISTQTYRYINAGNFLTQNVNFRAEFTHSHLKIRAGYALNSQVSQQFPKTWMQEWQSGITIKIPCWKMSVATFIKHNGRQNGFGFNESGEIVSTKVQSFTMMDATINGEFWKKRIQWGCGLKNIFNVTNINAQMGTGTHQSGNGIMAAGMGRIWFTQINFMLTQ